MVFSNQYVKQKRPRGQINAPPLRAILMAMQARWINTEGVAQCGMSRATLEVIGCCYWVTTLSVLPRQPPGQQQTDQR
jgi:hypothetical protein